MVRLKQSFPVTEKQDEKVVMQTFFTESKQNEREIGTLEHAIAYSRKKRRQYERREEYKEKEGEMKHEPVKENSSKKEKNKNKKLKKEAPARTVVQQDRRKCSICFRMTVNYNIVATMERASTIDDVLGSNLITVDSMRQKYFLVVCKRHLTTEFEAKTLEMFGRKYSVQEMMCLKREGMWPERVHEIEFDDEQLGRGESTVSSSLTIDKTVPADEAFPNDPNFLDSEKTGYSLNCEQSTSISEANRSVQSNKKSTLILKKPPLPTVAWKRTRAPKILREVRMLPEEEKDSEEVDEEPTTIEEDVLALTSEERALLFKVDEKDMEERVKRSLGSDWRVRILEELDKGLSTTSGDTTSTSVSDPSVMPIMRKVPLLREVQKKMWREVEDVTAGNSEETTSALLFEERVKLKKEEHLRMETTLATARKVRLLSALRKEVLGMIDGVPVSDSEATTSTSSLDAMRVKLREEDTKEEVCRMSGGSNGFEVKTEEAMEEDCGTVNDQPIDNVKQETFDEYEMINVEQLMKQS